MDNFNKKIRELEKKYPDKSSEVISHIAIQTLKKCPDCKKAKLEYVTEEPLLTLKCANCGCDVWVWELKLS